MTTKKKTTSLSRTLSARPELFVPSSCTSNVPLIRQHLKDHPKVVFYDNFFDSWKYYPRNLPLPSLLIQSDLYTPIQQFTYCAFNYGRLQWYMCAIDTTEAGEQIRGVSKGDTSFTCISHQKHMYSSELLWGDKFYWVMPLVSKEDQKKY